MAISETQRSRSVVVKGPIDLRFQQEEGYGDAITGSTPGVAIEVQMEGIVVWRKEVYPIFIWMRESLFEIPRPRYAQRIAAAEKKAQKIASKLG